MRTLLLALPLLAANAGDPERAAPPAAAADPETIPPAIRAMLDAAMASGNDNDVTVIVRYARAAAPDSAEAVARIANEWRTRKRREHERSIREAGVFELVKGRAEVGGYATTGNTSNIGLTALLDVRREGLQTRHKVRLQADYQESRGLVSREHYLASYEPNYKISDAAYVYGAAQYESDRFLGYNDRYSLSAGAGYIPVRDANGVTLELELGPAFRETHFTDATIDRDFGARGSFDFDWKLSPAITVNQDTSAYFQESNSSLSSLSALRAKLFGPFSAQLSYQLQYESEPPEGRRSTDTTTRASLVVDF